MGIVNGVDAVDLPEEEQRDDQGQREDQSLAREVATLNGCYIHWNAAASHCDG